MKRFLLEVAAFLAVQAAVALAVEGTYWRLLGRDHFLAALEDKIRLLETERPPRVLLVGGSSFAFGVNSARLERVLGRPVVNTGLHAGVGIDFVLGPAERAMAGGDLVLLSPEYGLFVPSLAADASLIWQQVLRVPSSVQDVPARAVPMLLDRGLALPAQRLQALWSYARHGRPDSVYWRDRFDAHGDFVGHLDYPSWNGGGQHANVHVPEPAAWDRLARFAARARAVGATVLVVPPPIPADDHERQREAIDGLWAEVARRTGLRVARAVPLERSAFFDTAYHLTREGRGQRTSDLLRALALGEADGGPRAAERAHRAPE